MDKYLNQLINKIIETDTGKLQKYYKNESAKKNVVRDTSIYKYSLGTARIDELNSILKTNKLPEGKNYVILTTIRYDIKYNLYSSIELASIISTIKVVETSEGLNLLGQIEVLPNDKDLKISPFKMETGTSVTSTQSMLNFFETLNDIINSIDGNKVELKKYIEVAHEILD